jgi:HAMP domain-containing protein
LRSLRSKLIFYISLLVAGLVFAAGVIEVRKRSTELNDELLENSENFSVISAPGLLERTRALYFQADRFRELEASVRQVMARNRALTQVQVVDTLFGIVLFDSTEFEEGYYGFKRSPRVFDGQKLLADVELNKPIVERRNASVRVVVPLFAGKEIANPRDVNRAIVFDYSTAQVQKALSDMRLRYALQAVLFLLIGVVLAALQSQAITRPLVALTQGAKQIARGDLDHRVKLKSKDELGVLGSQRWAASSARTSSSRSSTSSRTSSSPTPRTSCARPSTASWGCSARCSTAPTAP